MRIRIAPMKLALAALAALSIASAAHAAPKVEAAWTRPAAQGQTGAGFMTLKNPDAKADALVAVESPLARTVQIHQSSMSGGMAAMKRSRGCKCRPAAGSPSPPADTT